MDKIRPADQGYENIILTGPSTTSKPFDYINLAKMKHINVKLNSTYGRLKN